MLQQVLRSFARSEVRTQQELATVLGLAPDLVLQMLTHLEQLGYLRVAQTCSDGCAGCALSAQGCGEAGAARLWTLTEKGRRAIALPERPL